MTRISDYTSPNLSRRLVTRKPSISGPGGIIVTQNRVASEVGARVLKSGGHAVDAIVAAAFAIGITEPWMSGIGGVGAMLVHDAALGKVTAFDFGGVSPKSLKVEDFKLVGGADSDLFGWPAVEGNINTHGAKAVVTPTQPLGLSLAHARFGRKPWAGLLAPAIALAEAGPVVDWFTTLMIATAMGDLARDPEAARRFLPSGVPPVSQGPALSDGPLRLPMKALAQTLAVVAEQGATALYRGPLAKGIADDVRDLGGYLGEADLAAARAVEVKPLVETRGAHKVHLLPELSGGPTIAVALRALAGHKPKGGKPSAADYVAYAKALQAAWTDRFARMGDAGERSAPTCTTHMTAVDREGNVATLTQTLLSLFGARIVLPQSGILMNNGINWLDPRPGRPNSMAPGRRVLANYTPAILQSPGSAMGVGGCGGRKIIPAVFQLLAMRADFGMDMDSLFAQPRLDVSGGTAVVTDRRMSKTVLAQLDRTFETILAEPVVYANPYTLANAVLREGKINSAATEPLQPWSEAVSEDEV